MHRWKYDIEYVTKAEIMAFCVQDEEWQEFRLSLKGKPTRIKLELLALWKESHPDRRGQVQVDNYLNALKRGGQLDLKGNIVR